jgi:hypothetical protein
MSGYWEREQLAESLLAALAAAGKDLAALTVDDLPRAASGGRRPRCGR